MPIPQIKRFIFVFLLLPLLSPAQQVIHKEVSFSLSSSKLLPASHVFLDSIVTDSAYIALISISGHCDQTGGEKDNKKLSLDRAKIVLNFFLEKGFDKKKLSYRGWGSLKPKYKGKESILNRRAELVIHYARKPERKPTRPDSPNPKPIAKAPVTSELKTPLKTKVNDQLPKSLSDEKEGQNIALQNIQFFPGQDILMHSSYHALAELHQFLQKNQSVEILICGHVCCNNDMVLSEKRAAAIYKYLSEKGINKIRMKMKGFSNTQPLVPEISEEANQMNRRVEIKILKK